MKRYLLVGLNYNYLAVPYDNSQQLASLVALLGDARQVESKGYGADQKFVPTSEEPLQLQFVDGNKVTVGDDLASLKARLDEVTQQQAQYSKYWADERTKSAKLEKELKALKEPVQPVVTPTESEKDDDFI